MQMRVDQHGKFDVRECEGQDGPASGQSEPEYTKCNALCGQGTRLRLIYDYDSNNIEATLENCFMPPCPGDAPAECPAGATPITTQAPVTAVPISKIDQNPPSNAVNNEPADVPIVVVTDEPANATPSSTVAPVVETEAPVEPAEDNDTVDTNSNSTGDTDNNTGSTDPVPQNPVNPVENPPTSAPVNTVDSNSRPAVEPDTTDGVASLTITLSLLFGIIINLH